MSNIVYEVKVLKWIGNGRHMPIQECSTLIRTLDLHTAIDNAELACVDYVMSNTHCKRNDELAHKHLGRRTLRVFTTDDELSPVWMVVGFELT